MDKQRNTAWLVVVVALLCLCGCGAASSEGQRRAVAPATPSPRITTLPPTAAATMTAVPTATATAVPTATSEPVVRLIAVGDMLPHDTLNLRAYDTSTEEYDYTKFMADLAPIFAAADIRFCNQEAASSPTLPVSGYPRFNAPAAFPRDLNRQGCNLITLANNHLADHGQAGIDGTLALWDTLPTLAVAGVSRSAEEQAAPRTFSINGIRFAFVAVSEASNVPPPAPFSLNLLEAPSVDAQLAAARAAADVVIVAAHWGYEDAATPSDGQRWWAQRLADAGADLIVGSGPHVLQPVEWLTTPRGQSVVWYSLGNLLSTQYEFDQLIGGIASMEIRLVDGQPQIDDLAFYPTYMHYDWPPDGELLGRDNLHLFPLLAGDEALQHAHQRRAAEVWGEVEQRLNQEATVTLRSP